MSRQQGPVLITGGGRGLGEALAMEFARLGHPVAICARDGDRLARVRDRVRGEGVGCVAAAADVSDEDSVRAWVERAAAELGPPRVLINNASVLGPRVPLARHAVEDWTRTIDINLNGTFIATHAVLPHMLEAGDGSIVCVSSGAAVPPRAEWGAYAVSKAAVEAFTLNLAEELRGTGVRANIVDPGAMRTGMRAAAYPDEDPGRLKTPEQTTGVFVWLAGPASREVSGRRFRADDWGPRAG